jgi:V/A-type H+-transporting ATPase subunit K
MNESQRKLKLHITQSIIAVVTLMAIVGTLFCASTFGQTTHEQGEETIEGKEAVKPEMSEMKAGVMKFGLIAAAVAFGLGAIGAGFAISHVGAAAMGAVAEKPQIAGQALIFVALAEGLVVFGFITALMILGKI